MQRNVKYPPLLTPDRLIIEEYQATAAFTALLTEDGGVQMLHCPLHQGWQHGGWETTAAVALKMFSPLLILVFVTNNAKSLQRGIFQWDQISAKVVRSLNLTK